MDLGFPGPLDNRPDRELPYAIVQCLHTKALSLGEVACGARLGGVELVLRHRAEQ